MRNKMSRSENQIPSHSVGEPSSFGVLASGSLGGGGGRVCTQAS